MAKFEVTSPNGKKIEIEGEQFPTEKELDEIFKSFDNSDSVKSPKRLEGGISKSIDLTPSGIFKSSVSALETPANLISNAVGNALYDDKDYEMMEKISGEKQGKKTLNPAKVYSEIRENKNNPVTDTAVDLLGYSALPGGKGKLIQKIGVNAAEGGLVSLLESLASKGIQPLENIKDTGVGASVGGAFPLGEKALGAVLKTGGNIAQNWSRIPAKFIERAVKPESKALDMDRSQTAKLLAQITSNLQKNYEAIENKYGKKVGEAAKNLPVAKGVRAGDLKKTMDEIYDSYSLSGNDSLNVAKREAGDLYDYFGEMIDEGSDAVKLTGKELGEFENHLDLEKAFDNYYRSNLQGRSAQNNDVDIRFTKQGRKETINKARKPGMGDNLKFIPKIEEIIQKGRMSELTAPVKDKYKNSSIKGFRYIDTPVLINGEKKIARVTVLEDNRGNIYYNVNDKINILDWTKGKEAARLPEENSPGLETASNNIITQFYKDATVPAKSLYDIMKNISARTNWNSKGPRDDIRNQILERMYGNYSEKLSNLSPKLKEANRAFSDIKNYQKNEGLRRILKPSDNDAIDSASSVLRNYNNSVTKGNTEKNLRDLENLMKREGYGGFINDVDDINAVESLNAMPTTGDNILTAAAREALFIPSLRAIREFNKAVEPLKTGKAVKTISEVKDGVNILPVLWALSERTRHETSRNGEINADAYRYRY